MKYISLFSGIEAASVAFKPLGWQPVAFSEIDPFACAVLSHHYPEVPNLGSVTEVNWSDYFQAADLVIGGSPCQSFSIAGKREGLDSLNGQLMFAYINAVRSIKPKFFIWENVPGVLSADLGKAFGSLLSGLFGFEEPFDPVGGKWQNEGVLHSDVLNLSWRVLDAKDFGCLTRRKRIFVVGSFGTGDSRRVLFERGLQKRIIKKSDRQRLKDTARFTGFTASNNLSDLGVEVPTLRKSRCRPSVYDRQNKTLRELTPRECERAMGFPDDYTLVPYLGNPAGKNNRISAIGNSFAVPVVRWIAEGINQII